MIEHLKLSHLSFRATFNRQPKAERQERLLKEFLFKCDCEACDKNFPCSPNLGFKDMKLLKFAKQIEEDVQTQHQMKRFIECCDALEINDQNFPSLELSLLQKSFAICLMNQAAPFSFS
jgi:hypothetical protein